MRYRKIRRWINNAKFLSYLSKFVGAWQSAYEIKSPGGALDIIQSVDPFEHDGRPPLLISSVTIPSNLVSMEKIYVSSADSNYLYPKSKRIRA